MARRIQNSSQDRDTYLYSSSLNVFFVGQLPDIEAEPCRVRVYVRKRPLFDYEKEAETWQQNPKDSPLKHSSRAETA